jgi:hypothetical protein
MKQAQRHIHLTRIAISSGNIDHDDLREYARRQLGTLERHDVLDRILPGDIDIDRISKEDIQLPSIWQILLQWRFWREVFIELFYIIILLIIKSKKTQS